MAISLKSVAFVPVPNTCRVQIYSQKTESEKLVCHSHIGSGNNENCGTHLDIPGSVTCSRLSLLFILLGKKVSEKTLFHVGMELKKVYKQGGDEKASRTLPQ